MINHYYKNDPNAVSSPQLDRNYNEEQIVKLAVYIAQQDSRVIPQLISDALKSKNIPVINNINVVYSRLKSSLVELINKIIDESKESLSIPDLSIGSVLRTEKIYGKKMEVTVTSNRKLNPEDLDEYEVQTRASCPNPLCDLTGGQFILSNKDGKLDYYCPKCGMSWHWVTTELQEEDK